LIIQTKNDIFYFYSRRKKSMIAKIRELSKEWTLYKVTLKKKSPVRHFFVDWIETICVAFLLALIIREYILQSSVVPTGSMIPTLKIGDRLLVNKFVYRFKVPERGDIVVFKSPHNDDKDYVKRCIGLPGERVSVKKGIVYVNGEQQVIVGVDIKRDYDYFDEVVVPEKSYFVMGDNRANSSDSRIWGFVPQQDLLGKAFFTFLPLSQMRVLR
jgi:signal peptidase I